MDHYKRLEQRVEAADDLVARLCGVLMENKGKAFKQLLDAANKPKNAESYVDQALELAFEPKGLASLSSSQLLKQDQKLMTAYQDKFSARPTESLDQAFEDLDPMLQLRDDSVYMKEPTPPSLFGGSNRSSTRNQYRLDSELDSNIRSSKNQQLLMKYLNPRSNTDNSFDQVR